MRAVAAYFAGKRFGRTRLIDVSPNKTWEGLIGGCVAAMVFSTTGALLMSWPKPLLTGPFYGLTCAVMALIGDLTVSLLKRSAGVKVRLLPRLHHAHAECLRHALMAPTHGLARLLVLPRLAAYLSHASSRWHPSAVSTAAPAIAARGGRTRECYFLATGACSTG